MDLKQKAEKVYSVLQMDQISEISPDKLTSYSERQSKNVFLKGVEAVNLYLH